MRRSVNGHEVPTWTRPGPEIRAFLNVGAKGGDSAGAVPASPTVDVDVHSGWLIPLAGPLLILLERVELVLFAPPEHAH